MHQANFLKNLKLELYVFLCALLAIFYSFFIVTLGDFNLNKEFFLSTVFLDMWKHLVNLDLSVDENIIGGEGFLINGKTTAYFLPFPAFIRGFLSIFNLGESAVLSVTLGAATFISASCLICLKIFKKIKISSRFLKNFTLLAVIFFITFCSPIISILVIPSIFWEAIIWASGLFLLSVFFSISLLLNPNKKLKITFLIFAFFCGLTLFTRATFSFAVIILFTLTTLYIFYKKWDRKKSLFNNIFEDKYLIFGWLLFVLFIATLLAFNFLKWGDPFEFYPMQYYKNWDLPKKQEFLAHNAMNLRRIPSAISYYFLPSTDNFSSQLPFIRFGDFNYFRGLAKLDYWEPTLPLVITLPFYSLLTMFGLIIYIKSILNDRNLIVIALLPGAISSLFLVLIILTLHSHSIRYTSDFMPAIVIFSLFALYWITIKFDLLLSIKFFKIYLNTAIKLFICIFFIFIASSTMYLTVVTVMLENTYWRNLVVSDALLPLEFNSPIKFSRRGTSPEVTKYLKSGWSSDLEDWGTWSNSTMAQLVLMPPKGSTVDSYLLLETRALITPNHPNQLIEIWVNGVLNQKTILTNFDSNKIRINLLDKNNSSFDIYSMRVTEFFESISGLRFNLKPILIEFHFLNPARPKALGYDGDDRLLSIGLISAVFYQ